MILTEGEERTVRVSGANLRENRMGGKNAPVISIQGESREVLARKIEIRGPSTLIQISPLVCILQTRAALEVIE